MRRTSLFIWGLVIGGIIGIIIHALITGTLLA